MARIAKACWGCSHTRCGARGMEHHCEGVQNSMQSPLEARAQQLSLQWIWLQHRRRRYGRRAALRRQHAWAARARGLVRRLPVYLRSAYGTQDTNSLSPARTADQHLHQSSAPSSSCRSRHPCLPSRFRLLPIARSSTRFFSSRNSAAARCRGAIRCGVW